MVGEAFGEDGGEEWDVETLYEIKCLFGSTEI